MTCSNHSNHGHCPADREDLYDYGLNEFPEEWSDWPLPKEKLLMPTSCVGEDFCGLCVSLIISYSGGGPPIVMEGQDVWWLHFFGFFSVFDDMTDVDLHQPKHTHWHPFIVIWCAFWQLNSHWGSARLHEWKWMPKSIPHFGARSIVGKPRSSL